MVVGQLKTVDKVTITFLVDNSLEWWVSDDSGNRALIQVFIKDDETSSWVYP